MNKHQRMEQKGILNYTKLPLKEFGDQWDKIFIAPEVKERLLAQAILEFRLRGTVNQASVPLHGVMLLVGPPGTGKTSLARGLANRVAESLGGTDVHFIEVEPHALVSSALGRSQQAVRELLQTTIPEYAEQGPLIVLLDEVETLAADRRRLSLEANPVDVHRATDAVLAGVDHLAAKYPGLLFIATSNFREAVDEALISRADLIEVIGTPDKEACRTILVDTLNVLAEKAPKLRRLLGNRDFEKAVAEAVGLDGREIRKAVIGAFTFSKETALDLERLRVEDLIRSMQDKKAKKTI
jgi:pachytene checkpoint protein 2